MGKTLGIIAVSAFAGMVVIVVLAVACVPQQKTDEDIRRELIEKGIIHEPYSELTREEKVILNHYDNMSKEELDSVVENMFKNAERVD